MLVAAAVAAAEPAPAKVKIELDRNQSFIECADPHSCRGRRFSAPEPPPSPHGPGLTSAEILTAMKKVEPEVRACARPVDIGKFVIVRVRIGTDGSVTTAVATGRFGGTPVGACVEEAMKMIRFRENPGMELPYPFVFKRRTKVIPKAEPELAAAVAATEPAPMGPIICCRECGPNGQCPKEGGDDPEPRPGPLGPPLTRDEISTEMLRVQPDVRACGGPADVGKVVVVRIVISVSGRVSTAIATGRFEGTPTGACVEEKVKSVQFRGNDGLSLNYAFPFKGNAAISPTKAGN